MTATNPDILLVDDDEDLADAVRAWLTTRGCRVQWAATGADGLDQARTSRFDAIILDLEMPDIGGLAVAETLRSEDVRTPILILSGRTDDESITSGLRLGADIYLTKPITPSVLWANLQAVFRRVALDDDTHVSACEMTVDRISRVAEGPDGRRCRLTDVETRLLTCLTRRWPQVVSSADILREVWDLDFDPQSGLLHTHIRNLRRKLDGIGYGSFVRSEPGVGYRLEAP